MGDTNFRKEWNTEEYEEKSKLRKKEQSEKHQEKNRNYDMRQGARAVARAQSLNLSENLNKTVVLSAHDELRGPGFHCEICNETYKDNMSYLDHINSPFHLNKAGLSNRVARSTLAEVKERLKARIEKEKGPKDPKILLEERIKRESAEKILKKQLKKQQKLMAKKGEQGVNVENNDIAASMGFGSFNTTK